MNEGSIKVGMIMDLTGPLAFLGVANANVAKMVIDDINAQGGLLGRRVELVVEDSATTDSVAHAKAAKLVEQDNVDVVFGGIYSSTRQAIKEPVVMKAKKLYIYPEQYEGQECDPLIFCTGPVPAQQIDPFIPWLMQQTGAKKFYLPSADYIWPHVMNTRVRDIVTANGGRGVLPARPHRLRQDRREDRLQRQRGGVQHDRSAGIDAISRAASQRRIHEARRKTGVHVLRGEPAEAFAGCAGGRRVRLSRLLPDRDGSV
jgi:ABC-type branched-subunit amino acid transport system substrate-binding protein